MDSLPGAGGPHPMDVRATTPSRAGMCVVRSNVGKSRAVAGRPEWTRVRASKGSCGNDFSDARGPRARNPGPRRASLSGRAPARQTLEPPDFALGRRAGGRDGPACHARPPRGRAEPARRCPIRPRESRVLVVIPDAGREFADKLRSLGVEFAPWRGDAEQEQFTLAVFDVSTDFIRSMQEIGYSVPLETYERF